MTPKLKWTLVVAAAIILLGGSLVYAVSAFLRFQAVASASGEYTGPPLTRVEPGQIVFRSTDPGSEYGHVASVPIGAPGGPRSVAELTCDRVDASAELVSCLRTERGIVTTFEWQVLDARFEEQWSSPLPGIPSRTRIADDSSYWASTAFVTGHGYATLGFSTATVVVGADGTEYGNLEEFFFTVNDQPVTAADLNFWGVTFEPGTDRFFATAASGGRNWLVQGDLGDRTLVAVHDAVECPSLSPDGERIAFKKPVGEAPAKTWTIAVLDLATGEEVVLPESRNVDDQVEWLDDETIVYGLQRAAGDSDVWAIAADGGGEPELLIEHAWSPSVVR
ncbi:TolB family protein [Agromyces sp. NPDC056965]|uniref:TolB family protein n=1 Tax=Agromyces sp. NPDC056965 TaxID=3345983 RepID=UPI00362F8BFA